MDAEFWHERWRDNLIAFHKQAVNHYLEKYFRRLALAAGARVLVPLCGKSVDMLWLTGQGCAVTGVELSSIAVEAFFDEQRIRPRRSEEGVFTILEGGGIRLLAGDFFAVRAGQVQDVAAVYDRAALVALPDGMRARYVRRLLDIVPPGAAILLLTFEYAPGEMDGPPFSVGEQEVRDLFEARRRVTRLESRQRLREEPKLAERGLTALQEHAFLLSTD